jgi:RND family efflux transporter MFP subunit
MPEVETEHPPTAPDHAQKGANGDHEAQSPAPLAPADQDLTKDLHKPSTFTVVIVVIAFLVLLAVLFVIGLIPYLHARAQARADALEQGSGVPMVQVGLPKQPGNATDLHYPCDVRANQATDIFPQSNGYLKKFYVDIQDHADSGQLLAVIDEPEVDAQLDQSKANLVLAQANVLKAQSDLDLAQKTLDRYVATQKSSPGAVSQEEIDQNQSAVEDARSALAQAKATVVADQANVQQLTVMQGFEKVYAPFSGTITVRNYDVGALLSPTVTPGKQMFSIAQTDPLRVFVNVPQAEATQIKKGQSAFLTVQNYPDRTFQGSIARTSGAIDLTTRTLTVEVHFPNKDGSLLPGMYGQVSLQTRNAASSLLIPSSALIFNAAGLNVAVVKDDKIHMQSITIGRDLGTEIEITKGLSPEDQVVTNPGARLAEGTAVQVPAAAQANAENK